MLETEKRMIESRFWMLRDEHDCRFTLKVFGDVFGFTQGIGDARFGGAKSNTSAEIPSVFAGKRAAFRPKSLQSVLS